METGSLGLSVGDGVQESEAVNVCLRCGSGEVGETEIYSWGASGADPWRHKRCKRCGGAWSVEDNGRIGCEDVRRAWSMVPDGCLLVMASERT
jgi:hypothetical protein